MFIKKETLLKGSPPQGDPSARVIQLPCKQALILVSIFFLAVIVEGEEKLMNKDDTHIAFVRPKALVDSSGTT